MDHHFTPGDDPASFLSENDGISETQLEDLEALADITEKMEAQEPLGDSEDGEGEDAPDFGSSCGSGRGCMGSNYCSSYTSGGGSTCGSGRGCMGTSYCSSYS